MSKEELTLQIIEEKISSLIRQLEKKNTPIESSVLITELSDWLNLVKERKI